jgi:hypothetical protein
MDNRAVSTVVEKTLAIGLVTLFVSLVSLTMFGGVVPDFRAASGEELAERTLAKATERVQQAVPPNATRADVRMRVSLPGTIRRAGYRVRVDGRALVLDHPSDRISARTPLALPQSVVTVDGEWQSGGPAYVRVERVEDGLAVRLETEGR